MPSSLIRPWLNPYFAILHSHGGIDYKCILLSLTWRFGHSVATFKDSNIHLQSIPPCECNSAKYGSNCFLLHMLTQHISYLHAKGTSYGPTSMLKVPTNVLWPNLHVKDSNIHLQSIPPCECNLAKYGFNCFLLHMLTQHISWGFI